MLPVSKEETDRIEIEDNKIILKTYGLPLIFWGYLLAILAVVTVLGLFAKGIITKLLESSEPIDNILAYSVTATIFFIPTFLLFAFFYEKWITKSQGTITITHRLFFMPVLSRKLPFNESTELFVENYLDSPNIAKMRQDPNLKGFENKGYFQLYYLNKEKGKKVLIDRHSRKADLEKIKNLLSN